MSEQQMRAAFRELIESDSALYDAARYGNTLELFERVWKAAQTYTRPAEPAKETRDLYAGQTDVPVLDCPFCGMPPHIETWTELDRTWPEPTEVRCEMIRCCCASARCRESWNRRAHPISEAALREALPPPVSQTYMVTIDVLADALRKLGIEVTP